MKCGEQLAGKGQVTLRALEDIVQAGRWNDLEDITLCRNLLLQQQILC